MTKWEYWIITRIFGDFLTEENYRCLGEDGWELCSSYRTPGSGREWVFKRPLIKKKKCETDHPGQTKVEDYTDVKV